MSIPDQSKQLYHWWDVPFYRDSSEYGLADYSDADIDGEPRFNQARRNQRTHVLLTHEWSPGLFASLRAVLGRWRP